MDLSNTKKMVKYIIILVLLIMGTCISAQTDTTSNMMITFIDEPPLYSGSLDDFVEMHLIYPEQAKQDSLTGIVVIDYWIDTTGTTANHRVVRGIRKDLDDEALRVARLIKYDKPAMQHGKPIMVRYTLAIDFRIPDNRKRTRKNKNQ